ncbi:MAG: hypothetical protein R3E39_29970 [Anaerolineae bacterium]
MTKTKNTKAVASPSDKRMFFVSLGIFLAVLALVVASVISRNNSGTNSGVMAVTSAPTVELASSLAPEFVFNLTAIPQGIVVPPDIVTQLNTLEEQVKNCTDYGPERRSQMEQHFAWLRDSSNMPMQVVIGIAENPVGRLIVGMSTYTLAEWALHNRASNSCLVPIGLELNSLLEKTGEETFKEFEN